MNLKMIYGSEVLCLPSAGIRAALAKASAKELKVLLALAAYREYAVDFEAHTAEIAAVCGVSEKDILRAVDFWRGAGVIEAADSENEPEAVEAEAEAAPKTALSYDEIPNYTGEQLGALIDSDAKLKKLIDECQKLAGKLFNPLEVSKVVALSDYLRLENEHILMLFGYCRAQGKTSVHYIEKTAFNLYNEGVDTLAKLEEYIKLKEERETLENKLRTLFGAGGRTFTPREKKHIKRWSEEWNFPYEMIERAYEITVDNTEKLSFPYLNKILSNWYDSGYKTLEDIDRAEEEYKNGRAGIGSYNTEEFFDIALKKTMENMGKTAKTEA